MTVESASYISGLNSAYPPGSDTISEGDDHLRLIKAVLKTTFPNANEAINAIHTGTSAPTSKTAGTLWYDTTSSNQVLKIYNGTDWKTFPVSTETDFKLMGATNVGWVLPTTDGSANQYLKTDAAGNLDWASPAGSEIPSQTGNAGKFLTTNGSAVSWSTTSSPAANGCFRANRNGVAQTMPASTAQQLLEFTHEDFDLGNGGTDGGHFVAGDGTDESRFVIQSGGAGKYWLHGSVGEGAGSGDDDQVSIYKNGVLEAYFNAFAQYGSPASYGSVTRTMNVSCIVDAVAEDYFELFYQTEHNPGGANITGARSATYFEGYKIV